MQRFKWVKFVSVALIPTITVSVWRLDEKKPIIAVCFRWLIHGFVVYL